MNRLPKTNKFSTHIFSAFKIINHAKCVKIIAIIRNFFVAIKCR